jgi:hypothetical protein
MEVYQCDAGPLGAFVTPVEERIDHASAKRAIERERETRHWTIPQFRKEFGEDWPRASAGIRAAADEAADWLLTEHSAREGMCPTCDEWFGRGKGCETCAEFAEESGWNAALPATEPVQPETCHICKKRTDEPGEIWCSYPHPYPPAQPDAQEFVCTHGYRGYCHETKQAAHLCGAEPAQPEEERVGWMDGDEDLHPERDDASA